MQGGLLAAAIHNMEGVAGIHGWAWIFILEGLATIVFALTSLLILQDFPQTATILSEEERVFIIRGLQADHQFSAGSGEGFRMSVVWDTLKDPKTYIASACSLSSVGPVLNVEVPFSVDICWLVRVPRMRKGSRELT